jgi:hypothetical protein
MQTMLARLGSIIFIVAIIINLSLKAHTFTATIVLLLIVFLLFAYLIISIFGKRIGSLKCFSTINADLWSFVDTICIYLYITVGGVFCLLASFIAPLESRVMRILFFIFSIGGTFLGIYHIIMEIKTFKKKRNERLTNGG